MLVVCDNCTYILYCKKKKKKKIIHVKSKSEIMKFVFQLEFFFLCVHTKQNKNE